MPLFTVVEALFQSVNLALVAICLETGLVASVTFNYSWADPAVNATNCDLSSLQQLIRCCYGKCHIDSVTLVM